MHRLNKRRQFPQAEPDVLSRWNVSSLVCGINITPHWASHLSATGEILGNTSQLLHCWKNITIYCWALEVQ